MSKLLDKALKHPFTSRVIDYSKKVKVSKKNNISLYSAIDFFIRELKKNDIGSESKSVAFSFTLAVFPAIIFLFTLVPYFHLPWLTKESIVEFLKVGMQLPESMYTVISDTVLDIAQKPRGGLLSVGFALALVMSTNGMIALMDAFNKCYRSRDNRNFILKRLIAVGLTVLLSAVMLLSIIVLVFGNTILNLLESLDFIPFDLIDYFRSFRIMEYGVFTLLFFFAISVIYYFAPTIQNRWKFFSLGAIIATGLCVSVSAIFSYYINNFGTYNKLYGSIGTLIGFMLWLNLICMILLIGFEINAAMDRAKADKLKNP